MINLNNARMNTWKPVIKIAFTSLFVVLIIYWFDFSSIYDALGHVSWLLYLIVISGHFVLMAIKALRWQLLLRSLQIPCSYGQAVKAYTAGVAFGTFTPGQLGDMGKIMLIPGATGQRKKALISTLIDRVWDFLGMVVVTGVCIVYLFFPVIKHNVVFYGGAFICFGMFLLPFVYNFMQKIILRKLNINIDELFKNWQFSFLLTVLALVIQFFRWAILAIAFKLPILTTASIAMAGTLVALLPVSFGGLGTREVTIATLFSLNGLDPATGVSYSLLMLGSYLVGALAGFFLLYIYKHQTPESRSVE